MTAVLYLNRDWWLGLDDWQEGSMPDDLCVGMKRRLVRLRLETWTGVPWLFHGIHRFFFRFG